MRINPDCKLRKLGRHYMIVGACADDANLTNVFSLNDTAAFLWEQVAGKEFDAEALAAILTDNFEVDAATARADVDAMLEKWRGFSLITG